MKPRFGDTAASMWWDQASPRERVAFLLGYNTGRRQPFPGPTDLAHLRRSMNDVGQILCRHCTRPIPPRVGVDPHKAGRPPALCPDCKTEGVR